MKTSHKSKATVRVRGRYTVRLTAKYQATIPREIRKQLHLVAGDEIVYELLPDDTVIVRKSSPLDIHYYHALHPTLSEWEAEDDEQAYKNL